MSLKFVEPAKDEKFFLAKGTNQLSALGAVLRFLSSRNASQSIGRLVDCLSATGTL